MEVWKKWLKKNYAGNYSLKINNNISMVNIKMIKNLPTFITDGFTFSEIHTQTIKDILIHYGFLIEISNHDYSFQELADMIKAYCNLEGKNKWYYAYLMAI